MHDSLEPQQLRREAQRDYRAGRRLDALKKLDQLIALDCVDAADWCLAGRLLSEIGEFAQALGAFENCIQLSPQHVEARYELGRALYKLGDVERAASLIEQIAEETGHVEMWMSLATLAPAVPSFTHQRGRRIREKFAAIVRRAEMPQLNPQRKPSKRKSSTGVLKLGYLSAHWHDANYMKPVWPLIEAHDRKKFEIHLFDDGEPNSTPWHWLSSPAQTHRLHGLSNSRAAEDIHQTQLDILVDLSAYSKPERLGLFVHRPAPVQIAWFNMYATSGFMEFDYIIGDRLVLRSDEHRFYTERCLQLPVSYLTFQTNHSAPPVAELPFASRGFFTFGCLATMYKITPHVVAAWAEILRNASQSRMILSNRELKSLCNQDYLLEQFESLGVQRNRIEILPPDKHYEYLKYYDQIDLALDTFPYNGGTTTMEAIWQGVPVLTFNGDRWASRTSRSILGNSHLSQFVVENYEQYIRAAVQFATHPESQAQLLELRRTMREKLLDSKACDTRLFAKKMESLLAKAYTHSSG
ncbi:MAG: tetratricopeptide repeat protein [Planctomycetales bacterium]|nr:tetratricopeptide repeat protein [Planctomycetales bacterium]